MKAVITFGRPMRRSACLSCTLPAPSPSVSLFAINGDKSSHILQLEHEGMKKLECSPWRRGFSTKKSARKLEVRRFR